MPEIYNLEQSLSEQLDDLLKEPSDFTLLSNNTVSEWGNKNLTESYVNYRNHLNG